MPVFDSLLFKESKDIGFYGENIITDVKEINNERCDRYIKRFRTI